MINPKLLKRVQTIRPPELEVFNVRLRFQPEMIFTIKELRNEDMKLSSQPAKSFCYLFSSNAL
jgi:hypothetical protein